MRHESTYFPTPQKSGGSYRPFPFKGKEFAIITLKLVPLNPARIKCHVRPEPSKHRIREAKREQETECVQKPKPPPTPPCQGESQNRSSPDKGRLGGVAYHVSGLVSHGAPHPEKAYCSMRNRPFSFHPAR